jgi:ribosomal protein S18 acetylase RimI-like enzyme
MAMRRDLERRGYAVAETTRFMAMPLAALRTSRPEVELVARDWEDYTRTFGLPSGLLSGVDRDAFHLLVGRVEGEDAATSLAFDFDGDRGIYNVATLERFRRRGLGTALTALQLHDARDRGCVTASLQASPMAERMYAAIGFADLGRFLEYRRRPAVS